MVWIYIFYFKILAIFYYFGVPTIIPTIIPLSRLVHSLSILLATALVLFALIMAFQVYTNGMIVLNLIFEIHIFSRKLKVPYPV